MEQMTEQKSTSLGNALAEYVNYVETRYSYELNKYSELGLSTGLGELDAITGGLRPGSLVVIGGRPNMGKNHLAINLATLAALNSQKKVAICALDLTKQDLAGIVISGVGGINKRRLDSARLNDDDWSGMAHAVERLKGATMEINGTPKMSVMDISDWAHELHQKSGLHLLVIDGFQLIELPRLDYSYPPAVYPPVDILQSLKYLARELSISIVLTSELNRQPELRDNKRPLMADFGDFWNVDPYADLVLLLYRDDHYHVDSPDKGLAEVIVARNKYGSLGTVRLAYRGEFCRFENHVCTEY